MKSDNRWWEAGSKQGTLKGFVSVIKVQALRWQLGLRSVLWAGHLLVVLFPMQTSYWAPDSDICLYSLCPHKCLTDSRAWWLRPIILALRSWERRVARSLRNQPSLQGDFQTSLGYGWDLASEHQKSEKANVDFTCPQWNFWTCNSDDFFFTVPKFYSVSHHQPNGAV